MSWEFSQVDDPETWIEKYGIKVGFGPDYLELMEKKGRIKQAEYGTYKYLLSLAPKKGDHPYKNSSAMLCLINDRLVPIGLVHTIFLDGYYSVHSYKYALDTPWRNKDGAKIFGLNYPKARQYIQTKMFETKDAEKMPRLVRKAVRRIIKLTEIELAEKLPKPLQSEP